MSYTNVWSANISSDATKIKEVDDRINRILLDVQERMNTVIGNSNWSGAVDPVIDGSTVKSLATVTTALTNPPTLTVGTLLTSSTKTVNAKKFVQTIQSLAGSWASGAAKIINWDDGSLQRAEWSATGIVISFSNVENGTLTIILKCTASPSGLTWPAGIKWSGSALAAGVSGHTYVITIIYDGSEYLARYTDHV